jgi:hypothetical protein
MKKTTDPMDTVTTLTLGREESDLVRTALLANAIQCEQLIARIREGVGLGTHAVSLSVTALEERARACRTIAYRIEYIEEEHRS